MFLIAVYLLLQFGANTTYETKNTKINDLLKGSQNFCYAPNTQVLYDMIDDKNILINVLFSVVLSEQTFAYSDVFKFTYF